MRALLLDAIEDLASYEDVHARIHEKGIQIVGARITEVLDLEGCRVPRDSILLDSFFNATPVFKYADLRNLFLDPSVIPSLDGRFLHASSVAMSNVWATGPVDLGFSNLGSGIGCDGARFFSGEVGRAALDLTGATFEVLSSPAQVEGGLNLLGTSVELLEDSRSDWPSHGDLVLDRFTYEAFVGSAPVDAALRVDWLSRQGPVNSPADFWPQPWEQCAKVLREMGHREDARKILIVKEKRQRKAARVRVRRVRRVWPVALGAVVGAVGGLAVGMPFGVFAGGAMFAGLALLIGLGWWRWVKDATLAITVRYGHVPLLAFAWLAGFLALGALVFDAAAARDAIKPNSSRVFRADEWYQCHPDYVPGLGERARNVGTSQLDCYLAQDEAKSHPRFNPFIYSADTLLPIVDLEMQGYWIPDDRALVFGRWTRVFLWVQIAIGWALSLLAVAGFSGLIRTDSTK